MALKFSNVPLRKLLMRAVILLFSFLLVICSCNWYVNSSADAFIYDRLSELPEGKYGLLLGTSKYFSKNDKNTFYQSRINAAFLLYKKRKVRKFIISGSAEKYYNEPKQIAKDLVKLGIPDSILITDTNGNNTLQSVNFLKRIHADSITVISQRSQVQRAIFLASRSGIHAIAYPASDPVADNYRIRVREFFAKAKAVWDSWFRLA